MIGEQMGLVITLCVVGVLFVALARNWRPPDLLFLSAAAFLALTGIITPEEAVAGFANSGVLTVAVLFVVAAGLRDTGVLEYVGHYVLGRARTAGGVLWRLGLVVAPMSAFINNTPVVGMFLPLVLSWCRRHRVSPSKLLIPLSYFAILGGTCTLVGTSTNLVVNGLMLENGLPGMGLFEIGAVGLPYALLGAVYLLLFSGRILPERKDLLEQLTETRREYMAEMLVEPTCRLVGQTVEQAGLRHLTGLFLVEIDRDGGPLSPVRPDEPIEADDRLVFTGILSSIIELERIPGLVPAIDPDYERSPGEQRQRRLCEAVVSQSSPLLGKSIRDAKFRTMFGAAVVAVHREGHRVEKKVGDIVLRAGDTLLLQVGPNFLQAYRNNPAFYLISGVDDWRPVRSDRAWLAMGLFVLLLVVMLLNLVPTVIAAILCAVLMVALGCLSPGDARRSVDWQVLVTIAAAFGVGTAMENSGAANAIVEVVFLAVQSAGPHAALAVLLVLVSVLTAMVTNNAAAVLLFPICIDMAAHFDVDSRPFLMAMVLAASASFMTPIGYQTNMLVYGPGGYRFNDFVKAGAALNILLLVVGTLLIPIIWPFQ